MTLRVESPECIAPVGNRCGEGAVWHAAERALYWTDINRFLIHRLDEQSRAVNSWLFEEPVTALTLTDRNDTLVVVFGSKAQLWQPASNTLGRILFQLSSWPTMRCNDARADPRGSLWIGTMRTNVDSAGADVAVTFGNAVLYRIENNGDVSEWKNGIGISNTLAWSPENDRFYFGDSDTNVISVFSYDIRNGAISNERPFLSAYPHGFPDGSTMDAEGYLWNARYGSGSIIRVAPDGSVRHTLTLPVPNPTTCTFGGADRTTLYITSAGKGHRLAGSLFAVRTNVQGLPENRFLIGQSA